MTKLKILMFAFFIFLILSLLFSMIYPMITSILMLLSALTLAVGLLIFLSECKFVKIGKIKTEFVHFPMTYVLRAYLKLKHIWVVYDEQRRLFRPANWMDLPVKVILTILFGIGLLYTSYLIWFTITTALSLLIFRINVLIIFLVTGFYCLCIGLSRLFSLGTKKAEEAAKILNRNKVLRDLTKKGKADIEITPNFLIRDGFVTSLEFIVSDKLEIQRLNKILVEIAKDIEKIK